MTTPDKRSSVDPQPDLEPPIEVVIYWCIKCGWKSVQNFNDEGLPCVRCLCPGSLRAATYVHERWMP